MQHQVLTMAHNRSSACTTWNAVIDTRTTLLATN